jgi:hypothetical protein
VWPDQNRFWPKPNATNCSNFDPLYEAPVRHVEKDCYSRWYYWQLPQDQADAVSRAVVWVLYALHQIGHWVLIWFAQQHKKEMLENKVVRSSFFLFKSHLRKKCTSQSCVGTTGHLLESRGFSIFFILSKRIRHTTPQLKMSSFKPRKVIFLMIIFRGFLFIKRFCISHTMFAFI